MRPSVARAALACSLLFAIVAGAEDGKQPQELLGRVVSVADGDTLTLLVGSDRVKVRLAQIDAPESDQPHGDASTAALRAIAAGQEARVLVVDRDRYGRSVGEVFVAGANVNERMVREGHAWAYTEYSPSAAIVALEDEARAAKAGLWALPAEQRDAPWEWRRAKRARRDAATPEPKPLVCGTRHTCKQMASCREARFHLDQCGLTRLDGDGDGVPCEKLCGGSR